MVGGGKFGETFCQYNFAHIQAKPSGNFGKKSKRASMKSSAVVSICFNKTF